jgi:trans-aconitate methyltransferase
MASDAMQAFDDGAAYERFMGRWSRAAGSIFLDWIAPLTGARWLDVGCGTGAFTELVLDTCSPSAISAIDPATGQIEFARGQTIARLVDFRVADAAALPFPDGMFDIVVSALVINFISDRLRAIAEMRRVCRPGGMVTGYVWDLAGAQSPNSPLHAGMRAIGVAPPPHAGTDSSRLEALHSLFAQSGLVDISTTTIDVTASFSSFHEFWETQTANRTPVAMAIAALARVDRDRLIEAVRACLSIASDGSIAYSARAHAVRARVGS